MFDASNTRKVPLWLPLGCFLVAALLYFLSRLYSESTWLRDFWWVTLPLAFVSLTVVLRSRSSEP